MRLSGSRCGKCYTPKRIFQQPSALTGLALAAIAALFAGLALILLRKAGI
jgi:hypothetical protein